MTILAATAPLVLAATTPTGPEPEDVTPGLLGFTVVALMALALWFLLRSMTKRLRKVRFEEQAEAPQRPAARPGGGGAEPPA